MRRPLALALFLAAGCGPRAISPPPSSATPPAPSASAGWQPIPQDEDAAHMRELVDAMMKRVVRARELPEKTKVPSKTLSRPALLKQVHDHADKDVPKSIVDAQGEMLIALGLIPETYDYEKGVFELLEAQLAGYYEPQDRTMYLAADLGDDDAEATLAHELVHALQDQHYDLGPKIAYRDDAGDVTSSIHALAEGDAMSAMLDVMMAKGRKNGPNALDLPDEAIGIQMRAMTLMSPGTASIPAVLKSSLVAPYVDGLVFVNRVRRKGGWAAVDRVWKNPPVTTEQLLHLDKYEKAEAELGVPAPPLDALGGGWRSVYSDHMGEQGVRIAFEDWGSQGEATRAAAGWGGDRVTVLERPTKDRGNEHLVVWWIRYDGNPTANPDADEAFALVAKGVSPGGRHGGGATLCRERTTLGPFAAAKFGSDVIIVAGPYIHPEAGRKSSGSCADVETWLKQPSKR